MIFTDLAFHKTEDEKPKTAFALNFNFTPAELDETIQQYPEFKNILEALKKDTIEHYKPFESQIGVVNTYTESVGRTDTLRRYNVYGNFEYSNWADTLPKGSVVEISYKLVSLPK